MGLTCLTCGHAGFTNAFVHCVACLDSVVHRYCLDIIPNTFDKYVHWLCDNCDVKVQHKRHKMNFKALENGEGLIVDSAELSNKLSFQENEKENTKNNQSKLPNVDEKQNVKEKNRSMVEPAMEEEQNSKKLRKECTSRDSLIQAKLGDESVLPKEKEEKKRDEKILSKQPVESNAKTGSANNIKEDGVTASSGFDNQGFEMNSEARIIALTNNQNVFGKDLSILPNLDPERPNEPQVYPIWRGCFEILDPHQHRLEGLVAHLSTKACVKAYDVACQFQPVLQLELVPRLDVWPKSFRKSKPSEDNIALYFFPSHTRMSEYEQLIKKMMGGDMALRARVQNAELLLFSSTELPIRHWRFQEYYYVWGVFKGKQPALTQTEPHNNDLECKNAKNENTLKRLNHVGVNEVDFRDLRM